MKVRVWLVMVTFRKGTHQALGRSQLRIQGWESIPRGHSPGMLETHALTAETCRLKTAKKEKQYLDPSQLMSWIYSGLLLQTETQWNLGFLV